jgi:Recombination endonuclease VII
MFSQLEWFKKRYREDPEFRRRHLERCRAYRAANRDEINARERRRRSGPEYRQRVRERSKNPRQYKLLSAYGISIAQYDAMLARQGGVCAICQKHRGKTLCVDHCHVTGKVRGLLCRLCNAAIGFLEDDPRNAWAAAVYLEAARRKHRKGSVDDPLPPLDLLERWRADCACGLSSAACSKRRRPRASTQGISARQRWEPAERNRPKRKF